MAQNELTTVFSVETTTALQQIERYKKNLEGLAALNPKTGAVDTKGLKDALAVQEKILRVETQAEKLKRAQLQTEQERAKLARVLSGYNTASYNQITAQERANKMALQVEREKLKIQKEQVDLQMRQGRLSAAKTSGFANPFSSIPGALPGGSILMGAAAGGVAGAAAAAILEGINLTKQFAGALRDLSVDAVRAGGDFELTANSMHVFTGSMGAARAELSQLAQLSKQTPGLSLVDAEQGALRLRALGFEAGVAQDLLVGLSKHKILSGADAQAMNRVIVNLTQLQSGSPRAASDIKEMIMSMPTLRKTLIETFGSIDKFKEEVSSAPDATFKKLAEGLANTKSATGGLNDSLSKLSDTYLHSQRTFSEPMLDGVTKEVRDLTNYLNENEDVFRKWGQRVADILGGLSASGATTGGGHAFVGSLNLAKDAAYLGLKHQNPLTGGAVQLLELAETLGREKRRDFISRLPVDQQLEVLRPEQVRANIANLKSQPYYHRLSDEQRQKVIQNLSKPPVTDNPAQKELKQAQDAQEKQEQKDKDFRNSLQLQREFYDTRNEQSTKLSQARIELGLARHLDVTKQQEIFSIKQISDLRVSQIEKQIESQQIYFNTLRQFGNLTAGELIEAESKKNIEIQKLNAELALNTINTQKEIAQKEKEIYEERKKAAQDFRTLQADVFSETTGNPYVKFFNDAENAAQAAFDKFKNIDIGMARSAANLVRRADSVRLRQRMMESGDRALEFRIEARRLRATPDTEIDGFQRNLAALNSVIESTVQGANYGTSAKMNRFYASCFNPFYDTDENIAKGEARLRLDEFDELAKRIDKMSKGFEKLGFEGQTAIARARVAAMPSQSELVANIKNGDREMAYRSRQLLAQRARDEELLQKQKEKEIETTLRKNEEAEQRRLDTGARINNLYEQGREMLDKKSPYYNPIGYHDRFLAITEDVSELSPYLKKAREQTLEMRASLEGHQKQVALEFYQRMLSITTKEKGLKVDAGPLDTNIAIYNGKGTNSTHTARPTSAAKSR